MINPFFYLKSKSMTAFALYKYVHIHYKYVHIFFHVKKNLKKSLVHVKDLHFFWG